MPIKVSLSPSFKVHGSNTLGKPLLNPAGAQVILGASPEDELATSIAPSARHFFGPRGVCLHPNGSFWVADSGHHRLLGWQKIPEQDNQPADFLIGQSDFNREGRNGKSAPSGASCNVPTGVSAWGGGLALADPWNHRVLLWRETPTQNNQAADIILGQLDKVSMLSNQGSNQPTAATLHWPYGVSGLGKKILVCDTGNRRVLVWNDPQRTGQAADMVLGQHDFNSRDENAGEQVSAMSMRWPHQAIQWGEQLAVTDAGNNRIMLWDTMPDLNGAACNRVLGQADMQACDHNMAGYYPTAKALNMPYALADANGILVVADTANSRMIGFSDAATTAAATHLSTQPDFSAKGDNRWGLAKRDTVCWPYGLSVLGRTAAIADSGNNRVLIWDLA